MGTINKCTWRVSYWIENEIKFHSQEVNCYNTICGQTDDVFRSSLKTSWYVDTSSRACCEVWLPFFRVGRPVSRSQPSHHFEFGLHAYTGTNRDTGTRDDWLRRTRDKRVYMCLCMHFFTLHGASADFDVKHCSKQMETSHKHTYILDPLQNAVRRIVQLYSSAYMCVWFLFVSRSISLIDTRQRVTSGHGCYASVVYILIPNCARTFSSTVTDTNSDCTHKHATTRVHTSNKESRFECRVHTHTHTRTHRCHPIRALQLTQSHIYTHTLVRLFVRWFVRSFVCSFAGIVAFEWRAANQKLLLFYLLSCCLFYRTVGRSRYHIFRRHRRLSKEIEHKTRSRRISYIH